MKLPLWRDERNFVDGKIPVVGGQNDPVAMAAGEKHGAGVGGGEWRQAEKH